MVGKIGPTFGDLRFGYGGFFYVLLILVRSVLLVLLVVCPFAIYFHSNVSFDTARITDGCREMEISYTDSLCAVFAFDNEIGMEVK